MRTLHKKIYRKKQTNNEGIFYNCTVKCAIEMFKRNTHLFKLGVDLLTTPWGIFLIYPLQNQKIG